MAVYMVNKKLISIFSKEFENSLELLIQVGYEYEQYGFCSFGMDSFRIQCVEGLTLSVSFMLPTHNLVLC